MKIALKRRLLACIALLFLFTVVSLPAQAVAPRREISLDAGWRFLRQDVPGAETNAFSDTDWQPVTLPHTWNAQDGVTGGKTYYRGVGWYRRHFQIPPDLGGKSLFLKFNGAATVAEVYVNGESVGEHRGGFAAFCFDVTAKLHPGQDNVIAVKVNNARDPGVAPLSGDFTVFGGLYRDVTLIALSPLSITPLDDASSGVYVTPSQVTAQSAAVAVTVKLRNGAPAPRNASVRCRITDSRGQVVQQCAARQTVAGNGTADAVLRCILRAPHLWNGIADPYLYRVTTEVRDGKTLTDSVTQPLGLRAFHVDPNQGLFLNGQHYALHGVNRHQDRVDKGWAIVLAEHREDFELIREMGCTGIRLAHYQHAQEFYDLCDSGGLVVWAELPLVNALTDTDAFRDNARRQLTELIKQNYNHPSIFFWSLFNELHLPAAAEPQSVAFLGQLNTLAHQLDPTRLTTAASDLAPSLAMNNITDLIAFNRYYGWYYNTPGDWPAQLDAFHKQNPTRCIGISEYGAGANAAQHADNPTQPKASGKSHPEEWQTVVHEAAWNALAARPFLWGTFLWNMFDFASASRHEGGTPGLNDKGLVTYDRKTKKDAFFWYKANWTTTPFVYITSRRFTPRTVSPVTIKVYSNCPSVILSVNGRTLGRLSSNTHIFQWTNVPLTPGDNRIEAAGLTPGKPVQDECVWIDTTAPVAVP